MYRLVEFSRKKYKQWLAKNNPDEYKLIEQIRSELTDRALHDKKTYGRTFFSDLDRLQVNKLRKQTYKNKNTLDRYFSGDRWIADNPIKAAKSHYQELIDKVKSNKSKPKTPKSKVYKDITKKKPKIPSKINKKVLLGISGALLLGGTTAGLVKVVQSQRKTKKGKLVMVKSYNRNKKK